MVVKLTDLLTSRFFMFENGVVSNGSQARNKTGMLKYLFENGVVSNGSQAGSNLLIILL